jgi:3-oxoacyl-[acyl-carrier-protein] synthase-3
MTPDSVMPSAASLVQAKLGATNAFAYDLTAACSGFIFALATAEKLIKGGYKRGMVIGAETLSKVVDWQDRSTAVLFGDGAGGVLLDNTGTQPLIISESLMTDGAGGQALTAQESLVDNPFSKRARDNAQYLAMDGRAVFDFAIRQVPKNIQAVLDQADVAADEVDYYVLHQANSRILDKIARKLKVDRNLLLQNMDNYGNTSAASVPILLSESLQAGTVQLGSGQKVMLAGFGGGLTWGSLLLSL